MSKKRVFFLLLVAIVFLVATGISKKPPKKPGDQEEQILISGRNVNVVSGNVLPGGDPWLQRQNEPSIAVSTLNPQHLLAAANDYRTVDVPYTEGALPGIPEEAAQGGDAWLGVFKSFNGGESWVSEIFPGFPQDPFQTPPLYGYRAAADPVVRAGTDGLFYLSGIAFQRDPITKEIGKSAVFVARYRDLNDKDKTISYEGTTIIEEGSELIFLDKPWIAVDVPRSGSQYGTVYIAYSVFTGSKDDIQNIKSEIRFAHSTDGGESWINSEPLASAGYQDYFDVSRGRESKGIFQGATIAIDPERGTVYAAWRQFGKERKKSDAEYVSGDNYEYVGGHDDDRKNKDAIYVAKSTDGGLTFRTPVRVTNIEPFDQGTSPVTFRTNSYPSMVVDDEGIIYVAWAQRLGRRKSRIMISTSRNGRAWSRCSAVDSGEGDGHHDNNCVGDKSRAKGHQFMPQLAFAAGKLIAVWYDQRNDLSERFTEYIDDRPNEPRHTIDIRLALATPRRSRWRGNPKFGPSVQVSRYLYVLTEDGMSLYQGQFNPPNFPLFKGGTTPFHGDYIDISPSPMFVWNEVGGRWRFNTEPTDSPPVFHVVWTDNRDVKPPPGPDYDWTDYTAPDYSNPNFDSDQRPPCEGEHKPGMRNQNIYTSRISYGVEVGSPRNSKDLSIFQRSFVIFVNNTTAEERSFRLTIPNQPPGGQASFHQFEFIIELDVSVAPYSSIARPVFVQSSDSDASVRIELTEIDTPGGDTVSGGLSSFVDLNPGEAPPQYEDFEESIPVVELTEIIDWSNPPLNEPLNPNIFNPNIFNPNIFNPNIFNTDVVNPNIFNPNIFNPNIFNPNIFNPNIFNPNIFNPNIFNPNIFNASLEGADVVDVIWTARNEGNTTSSYTFKTFAKESLPEGIYTQLLIYRVHYTPTTDYNPNIPGSGCISGQEQHDELLANIVNPNIFNPNIFNPNIFNPNIFNASIENATFSVDPGEEVHLMLRLVKPPEPPQTGGRVREQWDGFDLVEFAQGLGASTTGMIVDTVDAQQGIETPTASSTQLIIGNLPLPDGAIGIEYGDPTKNYDDATLKAVGGTGIYSWSINAGQLPPGLSLNYSSVPGRIGGVPTTEGTYYFIVQVYDGNDTDTQEYSIIINPVTGPEPLHITTETLPYGVQGTDYVATLVAEGGVSPRTWSRESGSLPEGLTLYDTGVISGRITAALGTYNFTVKVEDDVGATDTKPLSITVQAFTGNVKISGFVMGNGTPLEGVLMRGLPSAPVTDIDGYYEDSVPAGWTVTVTPFKIGYYFVPESMEYQNIQLPDKEQDYNAFPIVTWPEEWVSTYNGPGGLYDSANEIAVAPSGNVYVTGSVKRSETGSDIVIIKYNSYGSREWIRYYAGPGDSTDAPSGGIAVDEAENVYIAGYSRPGDKNAPANVLIVTISYDAFGEHRWTVTNSSGLGFNYPYDIALHEEGGNVSVYVTGQGIKDGRDTDYFVIKYTGDNGNEDWEGVSWYDGPDHKDDRPLALAVDSTGAYVTGWSGGSETGLDYATVRFDSDDGHIVWRMRYDGPGEGEDVANDIAVDSTGVYVTGYAYVTTVTIYPPEEDPYEVDVYDYATVKYDKTSGEHLWSELYDNPNLPGQGDDGAFAIAVDDTGVYVTGYSWGGFEWEEGGTQHDFATVKYSTSGVQQWVTRFNHPTGGWDVANAIAVDSTSVYVTGRSQGYETGLDYATVKYDKTDGVQDPDWPVDAARYNGPVDRADRPASMVIDGSAVYVTGRSWGGEPGEGGSGFDFATVKHDIYSGSQIWTARLSGQKFNFDVVTAMAVDPSGNTYVAGRSVEHRTRNERSPGYDFAVAKYGPNGSEIWVRRYEAQVPINGGTWIWNAYPTAIAVDSLGVYVTGYTFTEYSRMKGEDYLTVAYDAGGTFKWAKTYNGPGDGDDIATAITLDSTGVYVTGKSMGDGTGFDFATIKYDKDNGDKLWSSEVIPEGVVRWDGGFGSEDDIPVGIAVDSYQRVFVAGSSYGITTGSDIFFQAYNSINGEEAGIGGERALGDAFATDMAIVEVEAGITCLFVVGTSEENHIGNFDLIVRYFRIGNGAYMCIVGEYDYNGNWDGAFAVAADSSRNVYVTGRSDINGGSSPYSDYITLKYEFQSPSPENWTKAWEARYDGPVNGQDVAYGIAIDIPTGDVFVTGESDGEGTSFDCVTIRYNYLGNQQWIARYNGTGNFNDHGRAIAVQGSYIYVGGTTSGSGTGRDFLVIKYKQS